MTTPPNNPQDPPQDPPGPPSDPQDPPAPPPGPQDPPAPPADPQDPPQDPPDDPETFPRAYVEDLRRENATYRTQAGRADQLAQRLMTATVAQATAGILADPTDLPTDDAQLLDDDGYPDPAAITTAAKALVQRKPHLADRRPRGDIDQGPQPQQPEQVNLANILRGSA